MSHAKPKGRSKVIWDAFPWTHAPLSKPKKLRAPTKAEQAAYERAERARKWLIGA